MKIYDVTFEKFATLDDAQIRDSLSRRHQVSASVRAESADDAKAIIERNWSAYAAKAVEATERPGQP